MTTLIQGDCLEKMQDIPDGSIDMILTDPPYGTTRCHWDSVIPLEPMWVQVKRVIKPNGAIALFGSQPFTTVLISSNLKMFSYELIWEKTMALGFINANKMPLKSHENILVFTKHLPTYNPQKTKGDPYTKRNTDDRAAIYGALKANTNVNDGDRYPVSVIKISNGNNNNDGHPTQKPVALLEYLIKTYTNESETVLDFTMGSGSTGVACIETNRDFIGIELDDKYFKIAQDRIAKAKSEPRMFY